MNNILLLKDLARLSGHTIHTIKYYLKIGLIAEIGRSPETNFRYFDRTTLERLQKIRTLRKENKSIAEIRKVLNSKLEILNSKQTQNPKPKIQSRMF